MSSGKLTKSLLGAFLYSMFAVTPLNPSTPPAILGLDPNKRDKIEKIIQEFEESGVIDNLIRTYNHRHKRDHYAHNLNLRLAFLNIGNAYFSLSDENDTLEIKVDLPFKDPQTILLTSDNQGAREDFGWEQIDYTKIMRTYSDRALWSFDGYWVDSTRIPTNQIKDVKEKKEKRGKTVFSDGASPITPTFHRIVEEGLQDSSLNILYAANVYKVPIQEIPLDSNYSLIKVDFSSIEDKDMWVRSLNIITCTVQDVTIPIYAEAKIKYFLTVSAELIK